MEQWQKEKLDRAFDLLSEYLTDNIIDVFEEIPEVDEARGLIDEVLQGIER